MAQDILDSRIFKSIILGIAGLIILGFVFSLGVLVGTEKAEYSFRWAEQYHRNFAGPKDGFFIKMMGPDQGFINSNGVFGQIIKIEGQDITVRGNDNVERVVSVCDKTTIMYQRQAKKVTDLKVGDDLIIVGSPDSNGKIQAQLIRLMPAKMIMHRLDAGVETESVILPPL